MQSSSTGNGGVCASDRIRSEFALTSMVPVFNASFAAPPLFTTIPVTAMTNSLLSEQAFSKSSSPTNSFPEPCSKIICNKPLLSRRSVKIIPPLFLLFATHPITVTLCPILASLTSVQRWVLFNPCMDSAIFSSSCFSFIAHSYLFPAGHLYFLSAV